MPCRAEVLEYQTRQELVPVDVLYEDEGYYLVFDSALTEEEGTIVKELIESIINK